MESENEVKLFLEVLILHVYVCSNEIKFSYIENFKRAFQHISSYMNIDDDICLLQYYIGDVSIYYFSTDSSGVGVN